LVGVPPIAVAPDFIGEIGVPPIAVAPDFIGEIGAPPIAVKKIVFIIFCLEGAVLSFNVAATSALVPAIAKDFALSPFLVGKIVWFYMLPYGVAALFYGPLVRLYDAKKIELVCIFLFSLANLLAGFSRNISILLAARFFMGFFGASVIPLALILIAQHVPTGERGRYVGLFFGATFLASLLGLVSSGILPWRMIFFIPAASGLLLGIAMYLYLPSFKSKISGWEINYSAALGDTKVFSVFIYIFLISFIYHGVQQWLAVYFSLEFLLSQFLVSLLITLTSLSGVFGEVLGGRLSDKLGRIKTINLGIVLMIVSAFLFALHTWLFFLAGTLIIWGLGWTFNHASVTTMLTDFPPKFLHEGASLNSGVRFVSGGLGAALGGILTQKSFALNFIVFGLCLVILMCFTRRLLVER
jgi:predicted MFS family arabinose efflux permease